MTPAAPPKIAAIILAAGQSSRMGATNKLLAQINGRPMIRQVVEQVTASQATPICLVTGHKSEDVETAAGPFEGKTVHNPDYENGLSTSLKRGIEALEEDVDGALIVLGDMPEISPNHLNLLIQTFSQGDTQACLPVYNGKRGNPVLWGRPYFKEIGAITGDKGARELIKKHEKEITLVKMPDDGILTDVDTPEALAELKDKVASTR